MSDAQVKALFRFQYFLLVATTEIQHNEQNLLGKSFGRCKDLSQSPKLLLQSKKFNLTTLKDLDYLRLNIWEKIFGYSYRLHCSLDNFFWHSPINGHGKKGNLVSASTIGVLFSKHLELNFKIFSFKSSVVMYSVKNCRPF